LKCLYSDDMLGPEAVAAEAETNGTFEMNRKNHSRKA
jgi:hypothetical protein